MMSHEPQRCRQCKQVYPLNNEWFARNYNYKTGFSTLCKKCKNANRRRTRSNLQDAGWVQIVFHVPARWRRYINMRAAEEGMRVEDFIIDALNGHYKGFNIPKKPAYRKIVKKSFKRDKDG